MLLRVLLLHALGQEASTGTLASGTLSASARVAAPTALNEAEPSSLSVQDAFMCPDDAPKITQFLSLIAHTAGPDALFDMFVKHLSDEAASPNSVLNTGVFYSARKLLSLVPGVGGGVSGGDDERMGTATTIHQNDPTDALRQKLADKAARWREISSKYEDVSFAAAGTGLFMVFAAGMTDWLYCRDIEENAVAEIVVAKLSKELEAMGKKGPPKAEEKPKPQKIAVPGMSCDRPSGKEYKPLVDWDLVEWVKLHMSGASNEAADAKMKGKLEQLRDQVVEALQDGLDKMKAAFSVTPVDPLEACKRKKASYSPGWVAMDFLFNLINDPDQHINYKLRVLNEASNVNFDTAPQPAANPAADSAAAGSSTSATGSGAAVEKHHSMFNVLQRKTRKQLAAEDLLKTSVKTDLGLSTVDGSTLFDNEILESDVTADKIAALSDVTFDKEGVVEEVLE